MDLAYPFPFASRPPVPDRDRSFWTATALPLDVASRIQSFHYYGTFTSGAYVPPSRDVQ